MTTPPRWKPRTIAAQALGAVDPVTRAVVPPLHVATTFVRDADNQYRAGYAYGRPDNATVRQTEAVIAALEGAHDALLFGSGMAAATAIVLALPERSHIVASQVMYWAFRHWLAHEAARFGHLVDFVRGGERFLVVHWLNPAHIIPLVEVVPGRATDAGVVERTIAMLEKLGKVPVRCTDSPGFIGPRLQALLMNEAVRLVEEGVATPEDVDRAFKAGMGFRYATIGIFEFIDWGGVDILHRASEFLAKTLGEDRFRPARLVEEKIARNELGSKTGRGFFDYAGDRREAFETAKVRALLRQLRRQREA